MTEQARQLDHLHIPPITLDFSKPLTPEELSVIAVLVNPDLKALRAKKNVAQAQVFNAGLLPDPQLSANYDITLNPGPGTTNAYALAAAWDIAGLFTRQLNLKVAKQQSKQIYYEVAWQEWLTANQAKLLAIRVFFLNQATNIARKETQKSEQLVLLTQKNLLQHDVKIDEFSLRQKSYLDLQDQLQTLQSALQKTQLE